MKKLVVILLFLSGWWVACSDCADCLPFEDEPYVTIRFLNPADSSFHYIIVHTVNGMAASELRHFSDTTYQYKFPLNMHADSSLFALTYSDTASGSPLQNAVITSWYSRQYVRRADNFIVVQCFLDSLATDLGPLYLKCKSNPDSTCISNEATVTIYF